MLLKKLAETIELTTRIPDNEKKVAALAVFYFEKLQKKLIAFNKHLNIIYNPFKEYQRVSNKSIQKYRSALWKYRDQIRKNFENLRKTAVNCVKNLGYFDSDPEITQLLNSFSDDMSGLDVQVQTLLSALSNWDTNSYKDNIVNTITNVKKEISEMRKMINDRIIEHINTNIISKDWTADIDDDLKQSIQKNEPMVVQLYKEREKQLKDRL